MTEDSSGADQQPQAHVRFLSGWEQSLSGELRAGGRLFIDYDLERLPLCRGSRLGMPSWGIWTHVRFHPGGQYLIGKLLQHAAGETPTAFGSRLGVYHVTVPDDATRMEVWFNNTDARFCSAWDSRYGENYWYEVIPQPAASPRQSVAYRWGALTNPATVNVFAESVTKSNVFPQPAQGPRAGLDLETRLLVQAWVRNLAYTKQVWIDVHVFNGHDQLVQAATLPLSYLAETGGGGDFFLIDQTIYQGSVATPGSVSPRPEARKVQYRLYYQVSGQVFTDGLLHEHELLEDAVTD